MLAAHSATSPWSNPTGTTEQELDERFETGSGGILYSASSAVSKECCYLLRLRCFLFMPRVEDRCSRTQRELILSKRIVHEGISITAAPQDFSSPTTTPASRASSLQSRCGCRSTTIVIEIEPHGSLLSPLSLPAFQATEALNSAMRRCLPLKLSRLRRTATFAQ